MDVLDTRAASQVNADVGVIHVRDAIDGRRTCPDQQA
jgi:hypothetical protein